MKSPFRICVEVFSTLIHIENNVEMTLHSSDKVQLWRCIEHSKKLGNMFISWFKINLIWQWDKNLLWNYTWNIIHFTRNYFSVLTHILVLKIDTKTALRIVDTHFERTFTKFFYCVMNNFRKWLINIIIDGWWIFFF